MINLRRQLKYLLDLDDRQMDILQKQCSQEVLRKSMNNTLKTVGNMDVLRRRLHFKGCVKHYKSLKRETVKVEEETKLIDPAAFENIKRQYQDKPWSKKL
jgi:tellurite resistance-related uncharacterized protein